MERAHCICPALCDQPLEGRTRCRLKQGVIAERVVRVDIELRGNDVEVTRQHNGYFGAIERMESWAAPSLRSGLALSRYARPSQSPVP